MKIRRILALSLSIILAASTLTSCGKNQNSDSSDLSSMTETEPKEQKISEMKDITSWDMVKQMTYGWNLGNTLDALGSDINAETAWQGTKTTKEMFDLLKDNGFNLVRVPVTWGGHMDENYQIDTEWMARVREVVDYGIDNDMYVILNTHHEDWYFPTSDKEDESIEILKTVWTQIAQEFKGYDEHLIFEGLNEPRLIDTSLEWTGGDDKSREIVSKFSKAFYETVRNSDGNNPKRHLMLTGYAASSNRKCLESIDVPENDKNVIVSVHAYLPYSFALDTEGTDKFDAESDSLPIDMLFNDINELFTSKEIPVIVGEFGALNKFNTGDRVEWLTYYLESAKREGVPCIWWDNAATVGAGENFGLMDRNTPPSWKFPEIIETFQSVYK